MFVKFISNKFINKIVIVLYWKTILEKQLCKGFLICL
uniref:Uncharacterized protein n=1 Tax=Mammaliicoccus phage MSShimriz1 TaxID=3230127 RepID=A0AAU8GS01_9VIRU